jgi:deazaflavin-dependent oxidoreductase (nitroreductase family)
MTFEVPPNGTHGARMPRGRLLRFSSSMMASLYRASGGRMGGHHMLLLETIGARSGKRRIASIRRFEDGPGRWLVVGSAGGRATQPAWVVNLAHNPDKVWAEVDRDRFKVTPEILDPDDRPAAWRRIVAEAPQFGKYEHTTDREMPVVRLTRETER